MSSIFCEINFPALELSYVIHIDTVFVTLLRICVTLSFSDVKQKELIFLLQHMWMYFVTNKPVYTLTLTLHVHLRWLLKKCSACWVEQNHLLVWIFVPYVIQVHPISNSARFRLQTFHCLYGNTTAAKNYASPLLFCRTQKVITAALATR